MSHHEKPSTQSRARRATLLWIACAVTVCAACSHDYGFLDDVVREPHPGYPADAAGGSDATVPADASNDAGDGWMDDGVLGCTPGQQVRVGCNSACGVGACTGDPVMLVCDGSESASQCASGAYLAQDDDACGNVCPSSDLTCPPSGRVRVLTRPYRPGSAYTCSPSVLSLGGDAGTTDSGHDACIPDCAGRSCGLDLACGTTCGSCPTGTTCDPTGHCVCAPNCIGRMCGGDGCGGTCGTCPSGQSCNASGQCICTPNCSGRVCGSNGCGGTCGTCSGARTCNTAGQCVCVALGNVCRTTADCCTGTCDVAYHCGTTPRCCLGEGAGCSTGTQCCSGVCSGGVCQFVGCA